MTTVGYMEGVDPLILTQLSLRGVGTVPVGNGFDNHGKFIHNLSERDEISVVVGHAHKFLRAKHHGFFLRDLFEACRTCSIPVLVITPEADNDLARDALIQVLDIAKLVEPDSLYAEIAHVVGLE